MTGEKDRQIENQIGRWHCSVLYWIDICLSCFWHGLALTLSSCPDNVTTPNQSEYARLHSRPCEPTSVQLCVEWYTFTCYCWMLLCMRTFAGLNVIAACCRHTNVLRRCLHWKVMSYLTPEATRQRPFVFIRTHSLFRVQPLHILRAQLQDLLMYRFHMANAYIHIMFTTALWFCMYCV